MLFLSSARATRDASRSTRAWAVSWMTRSSTNASGMPSTTMATSAIVRVDARSRRLTSLVFEAEPHASHRRDQLRVRGVVVQLPAERRDVHIEGAGRAVVVLVPDLVHEALAGHDVAGVGDQQREDAELLRRELDLLVVPPRPVRVAVDADAVDVDDLRGRRETEPDADPGQ